MIIYFVSAVILGFVFFEFGSYVALFGILMNATKVFTIIVAAAAVLLLWRKFTRSRVTKLPRKSSV